MYSLGTAEGLAKCNNPWLFLVLAVTLNNVAIKSSGYLINLCREQLSLTTMEKTATLTCKSFSPAFHRFLDFSSVQLCSFPAEILCPCAFELFCSTTRNAVGREPGQGLWSPGPADGFSHRSTVTLPYISTNFGYFKEPQYEEPLKKLGNVTGSSDSCWGPTRGRKIATGGRQTHLGIRCGVIGSIFINRSM